MKSEILPSATLAPPVAIVLGPARAAVSGVSTHLNLMFASMLAHEFTLIHFQVGSEGRAESAPARAWRLLSSPFLLAWRILRSGAVLVHINTSLNRRAFWRDMAYLLAARLCGARTVYQVHGGSLPRQFAADNHLPELLLRTLLRRADVIVVLTSTELAAYRAFLPDRVAIALPNGIDLAPYRTQQRPPADPTAPLRLIYLGRLARDKGLDETLQGLAQAVARGIAATLVVVGSGPDEARLKAMSLRLGLSGVVHFVGPAFDADKRRLLGAADILMLPSYAEGLPYALLEAMAAGVPAIATRVGGIPDVVVDGEHSLLVPVRDPQAICSAVARLAGDRGLLTRMSRACRQRVAHAYSIERLTDSFGRLYRDVCAGRRVDMLSRY